MNSGWRVIDLTAMEGSLTYMYGNLSVQPTGKDRVLIPLADIAVVLVGLKVSISGSVLLKLSEYDASVLVCDWRGVPCAGAYPWSEHSRIAARQLAQAALSKPRRKQAWAAVVKAKILGQARTVSTCSETAANKLVELAASVRSGDPNNHEALAARIYWSALSPTADFRRNPGKGEDGFNNCLDYAYTVLRGYGIRAVVSAGLSGTIGIFHHNRSNAFALVDDVIEPFRPAIDHHLITKLDDFDVSDPSVKKVLVSASTQVFDAAGNSLNTCLEDLCQSLGLFVERKIDTLKVPTWR
ncbi:type II CRISPR-associated endonuclease Cas1 [Corynebacterium caspium]|uniref:type II CRISPR-associated endonuclease Cas1 n=1 Tax=Corynebacterium caspium TaxID=234828 RepID=UPI0003A9CA9A|nr:type II CRISPR-associated endonuclease Cas1 [Corynebacterium caspium]WKD58775.1 CRISPR-associated endonuclease Cas1 [Corynebacterium caspium DSM 44850]